MIEEVGEKLRCVVKFVLSNSNEVLFKRQNEDLYDRKLSIWLDSLK